MGPEEAFMEWRMNILGLIGEAMVMAVMAGPPQGPFLQRTFAEEGQKKGKRTAGLIGSMREVAVKAGAQRKHPQIIRGERQPHPPPFEVKPDRVDRHGMQDDKEYRVLPDDPFIAVRVSNVHA